MKPRPLAIASLVALTTTALIAPRLSAGDWPQWRGAARDARADGFTAPEPWPEKLTETWQVEVGEGVATPALVGDRLYVFSREESSEIVRCLDAATGKEIWKDSYETLGADGAARGFSGPRCSPAVASGKVVTIGVRGILSCLDAETGAVVWRNTDFVRSWPRFYTSSSPMILDDVCIAQLGGDEDGIIAAFALADGSRKWTVEGCPPAYASPGLFAEGDRRYVVAQTDAKILAVDASDGKVVWETPFVVEGRGYNASSPAIAGRTLVYSGSNRGVTAVEFEPAASALKASNRWVNADLSAQFASPVVKDGLVYGLTGRNELFCLDADTGKPAWSTALTPGEGATSPPAPGAGRGGREDAGRPPQRQDEGGDRPRRQRGGGFGGGRGGGGYGSIVDAGPVLMALTPAAELVVFKPGSDAFVEIARYRVADGGTYAHPIPAGSGIFVKDERSIALWSVR